MSAGTESPPDEVAPSVRAQLLATEHYSLLASRSTTQNELLVRIGIFLTLVSASIVSLALVGQATGFDNRFDAFTIVLLSIVLLVGSLTLLRVQNGSEEDHAYVIGMNRLRAVYAELDPGVVRYFVTSKHDDDRGVGQTYTYLQQLRSRSTPRVDLAFRSPDDSLGAPVRGPVSAPGGVSPRDCGRGNRPSRRRRLFRKAGGEEPSFRASGPGAESPPCAGGALARGASKV